MSLTHVTVHQNKHLVKLKLPRDARLAIQVGGSMKVILGKLLRITLAVTIATQGAWFTPSLAASAKEQLNVRSISTDVLQAEYGAGGGSGSSCTYDLDSDKNCDTPDAQRAKPVLQGSYTYSNFADAGAYQACSNAGAGGSCTFTVTINSSKTFSASINGSVSGTIGLIEAEAGFSTSYSVMQSFVYSTTINVNKGYRARVEAYQGFINKYGAYNIAFYDANTYTTGYRSDYGYWNAAKPERGPTYTTAIGTCITTNCQGG
jgi:hypothetical protein